MKVHEIIRETTTAGGIASVAKPLGKMRRRKDSIFAGKKTKADADEQQLNDQVSNKMIRRQP
jgi:hypothetical protein